MKSLFSLCALLLCLAWSGLAEANVSKLTERLKNGADFRVRVQAALELGKTREPEAREPLEAALGDDNAAVRGAAAAALQVLGDPQALPALKRSRKDKSEAVRRAIEGAIKGLEERREQEKRAALRVTLGTMSSKVKTSGVKEHLASTSRERLSALPGVVVGGGDKKLPEVMVTGRVASLERTREGDVVVVRAKVEYVVHAMPGRTIRGRISGSASGRAGANEVKSKAALAQLRAEVLSAAIESAMRRAPEALLAATQ
ncbi:MAG: HEAT repeat domain-containing protein [Polyangiaceae bacterium]|nr:HEAT repeat domain-containing protein [Polyangiaceae bacterium]